MFTNQGKRKKGTNRITAKKCLRHSEYCGILNIKKDICANRCPTGATDRRLARLNDYDKNSRLTLAEQGGYFCVLLLSLPIEYPIPKQVKPKLSTAISPKISIGSALLSFRFPYGFLCNRRVTVPPERANRLPSWYSQINTTIIRQEVQFNFSLSTVRNSGYKKKILIFSEYRHWHF